MLEFTVRSRRLVLRGLERLLKTDRSVTGALLIGLESHGPVTAETVERCLEGSESPGGRDAYHPQYQRRDPMRIGQLTGRYLQHTFSR